MITTTMDAPQAGRSLPRITSAALIVVTLVASAFLIFVAFPYFGLDQARFGPYWPRRGWLLLHLAGGTAALLAGPVQLWLGLSDRRMDIHRRLGMAYVSTVGVSAMAAFYLAFNTDIGWVFGAGLGGLAVAWIVTTGLAFISARRSLFDQHKEWMIRSYVVTFAFVTFRVLMAGLTIAGVGTIQEQLTAASWFCWAVPLLATEAVLQGKKILASG